MLELKDQLFVRVLKDFLEKLVLEGKIGSCAKFAEESNHSLMQVLKYKKYLLKLELISEVRSGHCKIITLTPLGKKKLKRFKKFLEDLSD